MESEKPKPLKYSKYKTINPEVLNWAIDNGCTVGEDVILGLYCNVLEFYDLEFCTIYALRCKRVNWHIDWGRA